MDWNCNFLYNFYFGGNNQENILLKSESIFVWSNQTFISTLSLAFWHSATVSPVSVLHMQKKLRYFSVFDVGWITLFNRHNMKWMLKKYGTIRPIADADRTNYRLLDTKWPKYIFFRSDPGFVGSKLDGDIIYNDWLNGKCV